MAVHHFVAANLVVTKGWQPIDTFPHDGSVVEVRDEAGLVAKAHWTDPTIKLDREGLGNITHWRNPE